MKYADFILLDEFFHPLDTGIREVKLHLNCEFEFLKNWSHYIDKYGSGWGGGGVCVGFEMCVCFDNCVAVLVLCVIVFTVFLYFFFYVRIFIPICY